MRNSRQAASSPEYSTYPGKLSYSVALALLGLESISGALPSICAWVCGRLPCILLALLSKRTHKFRVP